MSLGMLVLGWINLHRTQIDAPGFRGLECNLNGITGLQMNPDTNTRALDSRP